MKLFCKEGVDVGYKDEVDSCMWGAVWCNVFVGMYRHTDERNLDVG